MQLTINKQRIEIPAGWEDETLLAVLHEALGLVGAKFGCGVGLCGACTILINGQAQRSCQLRVQNLADSNIETIEGLTIDSQPHPVQRAWLDEAVSQCGYCQAGQIMTTVALLRRNPKPTTVEIESALAANLCRCGTQQRIRLAVQRAADSMQVHAS
jgi:isoquinoline 1-oxidoreductase subunit alpha